MHHRDHSRWPSIPGRSLLGLVRRLAFWLAIALPVSYGPLLAVGVTKQTRPLLAGLLALNLACLVVGHNHSP